MDLLVRPELIEIELLHQPPNVAGEADHRPGDGKEILFLYPDRFGIFVDRPDEAVRGPGNDGVVDVSHDYVRRAGRGHGRGVLDVVVPSGWFDARVDVDAL